MNELANLSDTTAVSLQYMLVMLASASFTELVKGPFKDVKAHRNTIALLAGVFGAIFESVLYWQLDYALATEGFLIGLMASGLYRMTKPKK